MRGGEDIEVPERGRENAGEENGDGATVWCKTPQGGRVESRARPVEKLDRGERVSRETESAAS